jgi:hypothetical protein
MLSLTADVPGPPGGHHHERALHRVVVLGRRHGHGQRGRGRHDAQPARDGAALAEVRLQLLVVVVAGQVRVVLLVQLMENKLK